MVNPVNNICMARTRVIIVLVGVPVVLPVLMQTIMGERIRPRWYIMMWKDVNHICSALQVTIKQ